MYQIVPPHVEQAIKCGEMPPIRQTADIVAAPLTMGEKVIAFAHRYLVVPEGPKVGEPLELDIYQIAFIIAVFDGKGVNKAMMSIARRNGKTLLIAVILLAYICGPLAELNTTLCSAANSRDQAALTFELMVKTIDLSPKIAPRVKYVLSSKSITGLKKNVQYKAISAEAKTGHGKAYKTILLDEAGQIEEESTAFTDMLESSQQNFDDAMMFIISTQAPSDSAYFSIQLDHAETHDDEGVVSHVYTTDPEDDLLEEDKWINANPGIGKFLSLKKMRKTAKDAKELPSKSNGIRNLHFNQRVSLQTRLFNAESWRKALGPINMETRMTQPIDIGLDLSVRTDLTAAMASWRDPDTGLVNLETNVFAPAFGVEAREQRDKAPYQRWAKEGHLQLVPANSVEYKWVCEYLALKYKGCTIRSVQFDRYRIDAFMTAARETKFYGMVETFEPVGQGFVSMGVRVDAMEQEVVNGRLRTGSAPLLNLAVSAAVVAEDPAANRKPMKNKSRNRIDPLVAGLMAVYPNSDGVVAVDQLDIGAMIG